MLANFMKLLLDENLPKRLKTDFLNHEVYTVRDKGWNGIQNGELIQLIINSGFHALLTFDKNLQHQQNFQKYSITIFVLSAINNTYLELTKLSPVVHNYLNALPLPSGPILISQSLKK
jgi:predicted nuclease of predicted toxin-antitoxin system